MKIKCKDVNEWIEYDIEMGDIFWAIECFARAYQVGIVAYFNENPEVVELKLQINGNDATVARWYIESVFDKEFNAQQVNDVYNDPIVYEEMCKNGTLTMQPCPCCDGNGNEDWAEAQYMKYVKEVVDGQESP